MAKVAQLVERQIVVLDVAGSSPVFRPILPAPQRGFCGEGTARGLQRSGVPGLFSRAGLPFSVRVLFRAIGVVGLS